MRVNTAEINEILRDVKYNQHQERMIVTVLTEYPYLIEELKKLKKVKVKRVSLSYDHYLTGPKVVMSKEDNENVAVIYINK